MHLTRIAVAPLGAVLLAACSAGDPDDDAVWLDKWTATNDVCDWDAFWDPVDGWKTDYTLNQAYSDGPMTDPLYPSEACVDRVLADFNVDVAAFEDVERDLIPDGVYSVLEGTPRPTNESGLVSLLWVGSPGTELEFAL